jgi:4-hydroxy-tetrahydrodipicolinate reductase
MTLGAAIPGCAGRMGRALVQAVVASDGLALSGAAEAPGSPALGQDAGSLAGLAPQGIAVTDDLAAALEGASGVIDFTVPAVTATLCPLCAQRGVPMVIGTTGLGEEQLEALHQAAQQIPVVFAPNMSVGVNVLLRLAAEATRLLGPGYELEIVEAHHSNKVDAPSGTALRLAEVLAAATAEAGPMEDRACYGRQGAIGKRPQHQIGIQTIRGGDIVGEHTVMYCGEGERVELVHKASSRQTFARGAVRALRWVVGREPGLYDMQDVLGLG